MIYQLKITLKHIRPPIWRRFQVHSNITFYELHQIIQIVMGWFDSHLHEFNVNGLTITDQETLWELGVDGVPVHTARLDEHIKQEKSKFFYMYDFGDDWEHELVLEKILTPEADVVYPRCIKGKRACPPEDCGGVWGYTNLLDVIRDDDNPEREEYIEWLGGSFDAEAFDLDGVNKQLQQGVFWEGELVVAPVSSTQTFTRHAQKFWDAIPEHVQVNILSKVFCWQCTGLTTIVNFKGNIENGDLILQGQCIKCGGSVARLIERE
ncbi:MAG TPA: plasmid pRiA4b ORF-3 family protein [Anaerolineae bacterium]|nr:plasmid pRiA4b ORF-3 family protein [Anaerolineae bacterium]